MTLLIYLLKVIVTSAILFGYYRLFLRNKRFHHYNRFFLLSALLLSIVVPFIRIPLLHQPENPVNEAVYRTVSAINVDYYGQDVPASGTVAVDESAFTLMNSIYLLYAIGVLFLLTLVVKSLLYIRSLRKRYAAEKITSLRFYNTHEPGTPFSFFRSIFWSDQLTFNSHEGQQIFRHELFHVQHRHSVDRLFSEVLTAIFWFNPFFHLIKKELKAIHEFLADQFAISGSDRYAYATLLVQQALESGKHAVTNHFFQNHIKRRIAMITQFQQSKYGYWSRVMVLPLSLLLFCFITLHAEKPIINIEKKPAPLAANGGFDQDGAGKSVLDTIPDKSEKERELLKRKQEQLTELKKRMLDREQEMKNVQREELEQMKKQMMEQEMLGREQYDNRKKQMEELMQLRKEIQEHQFLLEENVREQKEKMQQLLKEHELKARENPENKKENEEKLHELESRMKLMQEHMQKQQQVEVEMMRTKMAEMELKSHRQQEEFKVRRDEMQNIKQRLLEREIEFKKHQQEAAQRFKEEMRRHEMELREREKELRNQKEKEQEKQKDKDRDNQKQQSSYKIPAGKSIPVENEIEKAVAYNYEQKKEVNNNLQVKYALNEQSDKVIFQDTIPARRAMKAKRAIPSKPSNGDIQKPRAVKRAEKERTDANNRKLERLQELRKTDTRERKAERKARYDKREKRVKELRKTPPRKPVKTKTVPEKEDGSEQS